MGSNTHRQGAGVRAESASEPDEMVNRLTNQRATSTSSDKVAVFDAFAHEGFKGPRPARTLAPEGLEHLNGKIDFENSHLESWTFQQLLEASDETGRDGGRTWYVDGYVIAPEAERTGVSGITRHKHSEDQIFIVLRGELRQGNQVYGPGSGIFMPGGVSYRFQFGAEEVHYLEIRHVRPEDRSVTYTDDDPQRWHQAGWPLKQV